MLDKKYNAQEKEKKWQDYWEENKVYQYDASAPRENTFIVDTPPPTVSGSLHIGHIFSAKENEKKNEKLLTGIFRSLKPVLERRLLLKKICRKKELPNLR